MREQGLLLSWVGSGRLILSHNFSAADFELVCQRFVAAPRAMQADGGWWQNAGLTNKTIRRSVLRALIRQRF